MEGWGKNTTYLTKNRKLKKWVENLINKTLKEASRKFNKDYKQNKVENLIKIFKLYSSINTYKKQEWFLWLKII